MNGAKWQIAMTATTGKTKEKRRKATPGERREQLIRATLKCIARGGIIDTTLADVAREAGLSQGIVNLHFQTKANLLSETLGFLSDDYMAGLNRALARAGDSELARSRPKGKYIDFPPPYGSCVCVRPRERS